MGNSKKIIKEYWVYYKNWMVSKTISPALNCEVLVTRLAWDHIVRSGARSIKDKRRRLNLMKNARYVLINCRTYTKREMNGYFYYEISMKTNKSDKIKVIVREGKDKKKTLYSWM